MTEHARILAKVAKESLIPLGLGRKGTSRTYLSDEGFWSCVVEFQPSGFSKGSYLNVSAHWFWHTHSHISFDYGGRVGSFESYRDPIQFTGAARRLASLATEEVWRLRSLFSTIEGVADVLRAVARSESEEHGSGWPAFDAAMACGLAGDMEAARALFLSVASSAGSAEWMRSRQADATALASMVGNPSEFRREVSLRVASTRARLKMPELSATGFWYAVT